MDTDLVAFALKAKTEIDKFNALLKPKRELEDDSFYKSVTEIYKASENVNPNIMNEPVEYEIRFTNGRTFKLSAKNYYKVQQIIDTLKYYTEKIDQLKNVKNSDKDFVKSHTSMYQKSSAPAAGGNAKTKKKKGIKSKARKTRINIRKRTRRNK